MEQVNSPIKGTYRDIVHGPDGAVIYDSGWHSNLIVDSCHVLLAALVQNMNESTDQSQSLVLRVGCGDQPPEKTQLSLTNAYDKAVELKVAFVRKETKRKAVLYVPIDPPKTSNVLQITAELKQGFLTDLDYQLREFGLFAKLNGTDYMFNRVRHPPISLGDSATLVRTIYLEF